MNISLRALAAFLEALAESSALPALSAGYAEIVSRFRADAGLRALVDAQGISAALAGKDQALASFRKQNRELVTQGEQDAERNMRAAVEAAYPDAAIFGEELGYTAGSALRFVFDPIDGTSAMLRSALAVAFGENLGEPAPGFGICIGVTQGDAALVGLVVELAGAEKGVTAKRRYLGVRDEETRCNGEVVAAPSLYPSLGAAGLACTAPGVMFARPAARARYHALAQATRHVVPDQNCVGYTALLRPESGIGVVYEADLAYHDAAALVPILQGAGLCITSADGKALCFSDDAAKQEFTLLAAHPVLHAAALDAMQGASASGAPPAPPDAGYARKF